jgi:adenylyltransferase/sulfurtransferase
MTLHPSDFYKRQVCLKEVGAKGQEKLSSSKVLVVGAGGLGCPVLQYLTAAGIGTIGICDHDKIDYTNLHRQILYTPNDIGKFKAQVAADRISTQNPLVNIKSYNVKLDVDNINDIFEEFDIIVDCTDNFTTKFLLHDTCFLSKKDLIQSSIYQFEGQLQVFNFQKNVFDGCYRCLWPRIPEKDSVGTCQESGVLGVVPAVLGSLQANEVLKLVLDLPILKHRQMLTFDLKSLELSKLIWKQKDNCPLCSKIPSIKKLNKSNYHALSEFEIMPNSLDRTSHIVDLRDEDEIGNFWDKRGHENVYFLKKHNKDKIINLSNNFEKVIILCQRGVRSYSLVKELRKDGVDNCFSLFGGAQSFDQ